MNDEEEVLFLAKRKARMDALEAGKVARARAEREKMQRILEQNPATVETKPKIEDEGNVGPAPVPVEPPAAKAVGSTGTGTDKPHEKPIDLTRTDSKTKKTPGEEPIDLPTGTQSQGLVMRPQKYHINVNWALFTSRISVESDDEANTGEGPSKKSRTDPKVKTENAAKVAPTEAVGGAAAVASKKLVEKKLRGCDLFKSVCYSIWTVSEADADTKKEALSSMTTVLNMSKTWPKFFDTNANDFTKQNPGIFDQKIWDRLKKPLITAMAANPNVKQFVGVCTFVQNDEKEWTAKVEDDSKEKRGKVPEDFKYGKVVPEADPAA